MPMSDDNDHPGGSQPQNLLLEDRDYWIDWGHSGELSDRPRIVEYDPTKNPSPPGHIYGGYSAARGAVEEYYRAKAHLKQASVADMDHKAAEEAVRRPLKGWPTPNLEEMYGPSTEQEILQSETEVPGPTNPKDQAATDRCPLHLLPAVGRVHGAHACKDGADKYRAYNWRDEAISLMGYTAAIERHLLAIRDGQDVDPKSGCAHLGHIIASASIILDAAACGTLIDDRPDVEGGAPLALMDYIKQARGE